MADGRGHVSSPERCGVESGCVPVRVSACLVAPPSAPCDSYRIGAIGLRSVNAGSSMTAR
ncbi:hypothetical protein Rrhod_1133 [Rhodococcus rhodnii LMG 5362]|uniref:Uncharacterized protein n=1 Tax=Rhodococcus rhodnii LMG 5362 TaxID=1273125 RepID=R7WQ53_9NOCA|nr:hypothetical protein Rrhod_1133 [Rhodococcus rhodnii LMG 5362]